MEPWRKTLSSNQYDELTPMSIMVFHGCQMAEIAMQGYSLNYNFKGLQPQIFINQNFGISCKVSINGEIVISVGYLTHIFNFISHGCKENEDDLCGLANVAIIWAISHEYFHIARGHFLAEKEIGNKTYRDAFEFDADHMATIGIYRVLVDTMMKLEINAGIEPWDIKVIIFSSLFGILREKYQDTISNPAKPDDCHMPIFGRLLAVADKLASIDNLESKVLTSTAYLEYQALLALLPDYEKDYLAFKNLPKQTLNIDFDELYSINSIVAEKWLKVSPLILKHQLLDGSAGLYDRKIPETFVDDQLL